MRSFARLLIFSCLIAVAAACSKKKPPTSDGSSVISLQLPGAVGQGKVQSKEGAGQNVSMATMPATRRACYGLSVTGQEIQSTPASLCSPKMGLVKGFVEAGGEIQMEVPRGDERTFELYLYLMAEGDVTPCPELGQRISAAQLSNVYFLGSATKSILNAVEDITIQATFPGVAQTLSVANSYPASCAPAAPPQPKSGFGIANAAQTATGGGMKMTARAGAMTGTTLTGGGMKLKTK